MPLIESIFPNSLCWGLKGVYNGQGESELVFLGSEQNNCYKFNLDSGAVLFVGFDTRIQPATVRMFYDPPMGMGIHPDSIVGFVQSGEIKLQSTSILPSVYSPQIEYRDEYRDDLFGQQQWLDMLPSFYLKRSELHPLLKENTPPFFAFNSIVHDSTYTNFLPYPMPNGNLYQQNKTGIEGNTLCASLVSPIGLGYEGPEESGLKEIVDECMERKFYNYVNQSESGDGKLYSSSDIWQAGTLNSSFKAVWKDSFLRVIKTQLYANYPNYEDREILQVEQVGTKPMSNGDRMYLLMKLSDPNDYYPYFCVSIQQTQRGVCSVLMYEFDSHLLEDLNNEVLEERSISFLHYAESFYNQLHPEDTPSRIGVSKPYYTNDKITFKYRTHIVEYRADNSQNVLGCIIWSVSKTLDADSLEYEPLVLSSPPRLESVSGFNNGAGRLNSLYQRIVNAELEMESPPNPNFAQWYEMGPRLPNNMQVFGTTD